VLSVDSGLTNEGERRANTRFPLGLLLTYRAKGISGAGTTVNISRCGVLFTAQAELAEGMRLELCLEWPVLLAGSTALQLRMWGSVVRSSGQQTAVKVSRHQFRTTKLGRSLEPWSGEFRVSLPLTSRELEILQLVAQGYKNKEIAEKMAISEQTVKNHLHSAFQKHPHLKPS
jgi:predicted DNA-binding protein (UPF0251 family)